MIRNAIITIALVCAFALGGDSQRPKSVWIPDNGDGAYSNPIIFADYSDPDVIQ